MARTPQNAEKPGGILPGLDTLAGHRYAVPGLGLATFVVFVIIAFRYHVVGDYGVETDFFWAYVPAAEEFYGGRIGIEEFRGPLYPIALALVNLLAGDFFDAGRFLSALSGSVAVVCSFLLLRTYVRRDAALLGALLIASGPFFVQYSYTAGTDMFFTALTLGGAVLLFKPEGRSSRHIVGASFLFALAYLTRYNGIFVLVAMPLVLAVVNPHRLGGREALQAAGVAVGGFLLFIAPWGVYNLIEKGSFFYNRNYLNIAYEMFAKGTVGWDQYWATAAEKYGSLTAVILHDPSTFIGTVMTNSVEHAASDLGSLLGWHLGVPAVIGFALMLRDKAGRAVAAFSLFFVVHFGVLLLVFYGERFSLTLLPLYMLGVVWTLTRPAVLKLRLWNRVPMGGLVLLILLGWTIRSSYGHNAPMIASGPVELLEIARWTEANLPDATADAVVVSRKPHAGYYLGMRWVYFPTVETYEQLMAELRRTQASYLYFGLMEAGMRPQFRYLLDPSGAPPGLTPVIYTSAPPAVLYRVHLEDQ